MRFLWNVSDTRWWLPGDTVQHGGPFYRIQFSILSRHSSQPIRGLYINAFGLGTPDWTYIEKHKKEWRYSSTIFTSALDEWTVSYPCRLALHPRAKSPRYPLYRRLGELHNRSGRYREKKNNALAGNRTLDIHSPDRRYTDIPIPPLIEQGRPIFLCQPRNSVHFSVMWSALSLQPKQNGSRRNYSARACVVILVWSRTERIWRLTTLY
jgi:hypothetical protein